jgi:GrpB-like predicted nucleotidyltransferase (UPF0157 family)
LSRQTQFGRTGFEVERSKIVAALGPKAIRVDHIGSTSIPGLAAKPIIDIDLSIKDADHEEDYLPALVAAGYQLRVREPGHRMVRTPDLGVHVHCCTVGSDFGSGVICSFATGFATIRRTARPTAS